MKCGTLLNRHDWEELGNRRVCRKCGEKQIYVSGYESGYWEKPNIYNMDMYCRTCNGQGEVFNDNFEKVHCRDCNGTGVRK